MSRNDEVAALFEELADRLEAQDDPYRPRAYRRAAENIRSHPESIEAVAEEGAEALEAIEGVGDAISSKVLEYLETGEIEALETAREELPVDMAALTRVEGVGPKTVGDLYEALGVTDLDELEAAAEAGEIRGVSGFGETTERNILEHLPFARQARERTLLADARPLADDLLGHLEGVDAVEECAAAGSLRRWRETVGDVDLLAASADHGSVIDRFTGWDDVDDVIEAGTGKASVRARGLRVDLRVVDPAEFGSALQYFTGSRDHNVALRSRAVERELKVNEYGVFDVADVEADDDQRAGERIAGETEASVYEAVGLPWIPPELREDNGELDAAAAGELPALVEREDLRGDLHVHTDWSDGDRSPAEMVEAAEAFGHDYLGLCDHATGPGMVGGVGVEDDELLELAAVVRELDAEAEITVFAGVEANIDADGGLSVDDDVLEELDLVVASPHSALDGDGTDRLIAAIEHPAVDVLGHPSGRLLNKRQGLELDLDAVAESAAANGVALEVNASPYRIDLWGEAVRRAVDAGATISIDTDAHRPAEFEHLRYGVHAARRGWAEAADVLTARDADGVRAFLH
ncbi:MAG: DNA polymerase/3'-5' exonuclease PolX [Halobacteriales archaeon]|nr:DNA polymerase/3'-5' exonuclease PolX [Halobacteriales archaeon]